MLLKTTFLLTKSIICPKTRLWLRRLFCWAFQPRINRMLCFAFPIFLHLQSCHTVSSLVARGKFRWRHIHAVIPRNENASFSSSLWTQSLKGGKAKAKMLRFLSRQWYPEKKKGKKEARECCSRFTVYKNFQIRYWEELQRRCKANMKCECHLNFGVHKKTSLTWS